ncbi:MAG TPA: hypothetical protein PKY96_07855 [Flavobacteriales bacterium]|nr:hypothetical protein [Flavobacteriales bacterium]
MSLRLLLCGLATSALHAVAQQSTSPIISGLPPDEYVDVTGDGRADLLITSRTVHISDPEQPGFNGLYKIGARTLTGTAVLMWSTPSNQRWYPLEHSTRLDTGLIAQRIHYKQLSWTDEDHPTEFWLLERPFGPAITKEQDGWYGTGEHHDGQTMVLRSANERGTTVAAFEFELPYPYGRVVIKTKHAVRVPNGYGEEGDPISLKREPREPPLDFGHEPVEPQVMVPPGIPPDEHVNLNGDEIDDLLIIGQLEPANGIAGPGHFVRGLSPLPGTMLLMTRERWGVLGPFRLREGEVLTPERLANGLAGNLFVWVPADRERVFVPVIQHPFGKPDEPQGWSFEADAFDGALVYRTMEYGRPIIGALEIISDGNGGQFGVRAQTWVDEGQVLELR